MKKSIFTAIALVIAVALSSCSSPVVGSKNRNAYQIPKTRIESFNDYALDVSREGVSYTIDISTPEGKAKLNNLTLSEAEELALTEAVMTNKCAMFVNPQFTNLMNGKRVLRITVYGFPAYYRNKQEPQYDSRTRQEIDININR